MFSSILKAPSFKSLFLNRIRSYRSRVVCLKNQQQYKLLYLPRQRQVNSVGLAFHANLAGVTK